MVERYPTALCDLDARRSASAIGARSGRFEDLGDPLCSELVVVDHLDRGRDL